MRNPFSPNVCSIFCRRESFLLLPAVVLAVEFVAVLGVGDEAVVLTVWLHVGRTASIGSKSGTGFGTVGEEPDAVADDFEVSGKNLKAPAESKERIFLS